MNSTCFICKNLATVNQEGFNECCKCEQCGAYVKSSGESLILEDEYRPIVSGYVNEHQNENVPFYLSQENINKAKMISITMDDKIDKLMLWFAKKTNHPGQSIKDIYNNKGLISHCYVKDFNEIKFFLDYLEERKFISATDQYKKDFKITVEGFNYIESLKKIIQSDSCFCAMSFGNDHQYIYDSVIAPAVSTAGYKILRVDEAPYNDGVVDKIMALIRQSKFLIADLTGNKQGVYYEAGFARGLGREVIFTCEEKDFDNIHFDVKHFNFLKWSKGNIIKATDKLRWRIESTIGRGNYPY